MVIIFGAGAATLVSTFLGVSIFTSVLTSLFAASTLTSVFSALAYVSLFGVSPAGLAASVSISKKGLPTSTVSPSLANN